MKKIKKWDLEVGDIIIARTDLSKGSDTLGYPARIPLIKNKRLLHNQRVGKVIFKKGSKINKNFFYWLLRNKGYRTEILASATGTTVKHTSPDRILRY